MNISINIKKVLNVKTLSTAHTIRNSVVSLIAVAAFSLPLVTSAATTSDSNANRSLLNSEWQPEVQNDANSVYGKLKAESKEVCGSSDRRITGGLRQSQKVEQCYEGTLTAAVQRLDDPEITELHYQ
jgi:UrcA family protein